MENVNEQEQKLVLTNKSFLSLTGIDKMISVKPELVQLASNYGDMQIIGNSMEVAKLDLEAHLVEIKGDIETIKYANNKKTPFLKRIFK